VAIDEEGFLVKLILDTWRVASMAIGLFCVLVSCVHADAATDPLPSWNDGPAKKAIVAFVTKITTAGSADFVPVAERIATFDNDGTL
jgi:hypothetical protein